MGRPSARWFKPGPFESWRAVRSPSGLWIVVDERGDQPLLSEDPVRRMESAFVAAASQKMQVALKDVLARAERIGIYHDSPYDEARVLFARGALSDSMPPWRCWEYEDRSHQRQFSYDAERDAA